MNDNEQLITFIKTLPNGKTSMPMELEINKMGTSVEVLFRLKLKEEKIKDLTR